MTNFNQVDGPSVTVTAIGKDRITPDTPLRFDGGTFFDGSQEVYLFRRTGGKWAFGAEHLEYVQTLGPINRVTNWRAGEPGWYEVHKSRDPVVGTGPGYDRERTTITSYEVVEGASGSSIDADESGFVAAGPKTEEADPEDFVGVVNADNSDGAALAPALRRRGIEIDDVGTTATFDGTEVSIVDEGVVSVGGERIEVGNITDSDEVARVTDGPNAGDPIATDADVAPDSSSGGSGVIGAVGVGLLALLAGAAALLGGGD